MTDKHNRFLGNRVLSPETLMMGYGYDPFLSERSLKPPVFHTSTFVFRSAQDGKEFFELAYGLRQKRPNPDFSKVWVHRDPGSEKIVLRERFVSEAGGARCRQSVAQICLALHRLKGARWWRRSTAAG